MAQVKIEEIIEHLNWDMKRALEDTVRAHFQGQSFNRDALFKDFVRAVRRKCRTWENVPDGYVEVS